MYNIVVGIILFVAVLLVLIILAQNPKGGGLTSTFGGSNSNQIMLNENDIYIPDEICHNLKTLYSEGKMEEI